MGVRYYWDRKTTNRGSVIAVVRDRRLGTDHEMAKCEDDTDAQKIVDALNKMEPA